MKTFNIMSLIDATNYGFTVSGTTIFTASNFFAYCRARYNHMNFDCYTIAEDADETDATVLTNAKAEFKGVFDAWKDCVGSDYKKAVDALNATYDPLENYDRREEGSETTERHKGSKTSFGEETIITPRVKTKNTTYKVAYDSSTETETDALVSEPLQGTDKTERDAAKNYTTQTDIDGTTFDKDVLNFTDRRTHGNIGVTTSQQMLASEIELRIKNYVADIIDSFIRLFCYYFKGVE